MNKTVLAYTPFKNYWNKKENINLSAIQYKSLGIPYVILASWTQFHLSGWKLCMREYHIRQFPEINF